MSKIRNKVENSSSFYNTSFLDFDHQLREYTYKTIKAYFNGEEALELGPASGFMTKFLINDFVSIDVVEGSKNLLDQIPNYENVRKFHSLFEDYTTDKKYDTVILAHVLEHIHNPVEICKKIYNWVSDSGVFIVSVPNAKSIHRLVAKEMGLLQNEYELNSRDHELGHYRVYDMSLLKEHLQEAGFQVKETGGIFLKPLSNGQIQNHWTQEMIEGFYKAGKHFQEYCAEIYAVCEK